MHEDEIKVAMDLLGCWRCQQCQIYVRKPAVNKWRKPGRKTRWTAEGKTEEGLSRTFSWNDSLQLVDQDIHDLVFFSPLGLGLVLVKLLFSITENSLLESCSLVYDIL